MSRQTASTASSCQPNHLEPSELGTKQYWDDYYEEDLANLQEEDGDSSDIGSISTWFDDVKAPKKILNFLSSPAFPLAPCHFLSHSAEECPSIIDIGTGNGQTLLHLRRQGFRGQMIGVDYSMSSIQLAQRLGETQKGCEDINFAVMDIIKDEPQKQHWWFGDGFDLVLDKGTFDAISLSSDIVSASISPVSPLPRVSERIYTLYPSRALRLVKPGGFLVITSCNWTQQELIHWFTAGEADSSCGVSVWQTIAYPKFRFGGQEGQGVCTVCFKKESSA